MMLNKWTQALIATGVVSVGSVALAEEAQHQVLTALSSTTLSGYVDTSAIWNPGSGNGLVGRSYDGGPGSLTGDKQDGFNLNVVKLSLEKPLDEAEWSAGYKADLLFGPDAIAYNTSSAAIPGAADFSVKQAYVVVRAPVGNGLDLKIGSFDTIIGYEVFESGNNPNYSRSFGYAIEPLSHTGVLASYHVADWLSISGGVANTWSTGINDRPADNNGAVAESQKTYMGSVVLTAPENLGFLEGAQLFAGIVDGLAGQNVPAGALAGTPGDVTSLYAGLAIPLPVEGLTLGAAFDYRFSEVNSIVTGARESRYANAYAIYSTYQATEKLKLALRGEYASGSAGTWGAKPVEGPNNEEFLGVTLTADYSMWANVITRAEVRWDRDLSGGPAEPFGAGLTSPADEKNAVTLALNVIYKF